MSASPLPAPVARPWREVPSPDTCSRGWTRLTGEPGTPGFRVQVVIADLSKVTYYDERADQPGRLELEARDELDLLLVRGLVDDDTLHVVLQAWAWRLLERLEAMPRVTLARPLELVGRA